MKRFKAYVDAFHYGNQDVSGDKGKNNGLTHSWLSSSLAISPIEQVHFLQQIVNKQLALSPKAFAMTKKILYIQEIVGGWKLYGKTGSGRQQGWFVGWIEKDNRVVVFASHITERKEGKTPTSFKARNNAFTQLFYLINELEKNA
jgi:beta-lactamase class D